MKTFFQLIIGIAICLVVAYFLQISPTTDYGWFMGIVHGFLLVPNGIISLFDPSWLVKAPLHTQVYNIMWWMFGAISVVYWIWTIIGAIITMTRRS